MLLLIVERGWTPSQFNLGLPVHALDLRAIYDIFHVQFSGINNNNKIVK